MLTGALLILAPLFLGFAFALSNRRLMTVIHYTVEGLVYFILALLGLSLGQMEGLLGQLGTMAGQVSALVLVLLVANMVGLWLFHRWAPLDIGEQAGEGRPGYRRLFLAGLKPLLAVLVGADRKSTRLNSSHVRISYAVFCLKKKNIEAELV